MEAKVISCTTFGEDKVIKIVVSSRRAVTNYKPGENETTVVVADDTCSKKDVEEIKKTCEKLDYVYEGRLHEDYAQTNIGPGLVWNVELKSTLYALLHFRLCTFLLYILISMFEVIFW